MSSFENESSSNEQSENEEEVDDLEDESNDSEQEGSSQENSDSEDGSDDESKPRLADKDYRQMPFEDLLQLKRKIGSKLYNEAVFGKTKGKQPPEDAKKQKKRKVEKPRPDSDSDGPPEEISAKRKVPALGMQRKSRTGGAEEQRPRDPRFDAKQGYFSGRKFRAQYGFINDLRSSELESLKKQLEETHDPDEEKRLKFAIRRTENQIREFEKQKGLDQRRMEEKREAKKALDEGKRPFYEKKNVKKARELVEKYDQLKEAGKLGKHIDKRRRKITAKDRKKLDFTT